MHRGDDRALLLGRRKGKQRRLTRVTRVKIEAYFLRADHLDVDPIFQLLERDALRSDFQVAHTGHEGAQWRESAPSARPSKFGERRQ